MSLGAVLDEGEVLIGGMWAPGRNSAPQAETDRPSAWPGGARKRGAASL